MNFHTMKKYMPKIMAVCLGMALSLQLGAASAAVSTIYPGAGKGKPKTPEWNVESSKEANTIEEQKNKGNVVEKIDRHDGVTETRLDVMLGDGLYSAAVSADGAFKLTDGSTGKKLQEFSANKNVTLGVEAGYITVNGEKTKSRDIILSCDSASARVKYNNTSYRGNLEITYGGSSGLLVVNNLSLEDYVKGVLPSEMSGDWAAEALKAQAVAARTFALYTRDKGAHGASSGYDLCSASHCQVYSGVGAETDATDKAVDATYGQVMYYNNQVIYAAFHSSSGGATENSENVWGNYLAYLRSVTDDDSKSPYHNWTVKFTVAEVQKKLSAAGKGVGTLQSIALQQQASDAVTGRSASGRAYGVKFTGSSGSITLTGEQARVIFGLKSAMFNISTERSAVIPAGSSKSKSGNSGTIASKPKAMEKSALKLSGSETIIFDGHGFGHGLGMAQYGAKAMADSCSSYTDILRHYYTDIKIKEIY